ncbi:MAG TPA: hypothetical protein V6D25_02650 [Leptolyngbyaceae cyanobacterium]
MANCPCCSNQMLFQARAQTTYWFCRTCWQEMPNLNLEENRSFLGFSIKLASTLK